MTSTIEDIELIIKQGTESFNTNNNLKALSLFDRAISLNPQKVEINYVRAVGFARLGRIQESADTLTRLLEVIPEHRKARLLLAEIMRFNIGENSKDFENGHKKQLIDVSTQDVVKAFNNMSQIDVLFSLIVRKGKLNTSLKERRLERKRSGCCPGCCGHHIMKIAEIPYYKTHLNKYGTQLDDFFVTVPPEYWFVTFDIMRCSSCEMVYVPETYEGLTEFVENHPVFLNRIVKPYLDMTQKKVDSNYSKKIMSGPVKDLSPFEYRQKTILNVIKNNISDRSGFSFLDLGSNIGGFAEMIRLNFQNVDVWGCEINESYAKESKLRYQNLKLIEKTLSANHAMYDFDFIYSSDVIEHIWNLDEFILSIRENLKSNGLVMLITPNVECAESKKAGVDWWGYIVPHHAELFCYKSLTRLMKRLGFIEIESGNIYQEFWGIYKQEGL